MSPTCGQAATDGGGCSLVHPTVPDSAGQAPPAGADGQGVGYDTQRKHYRYVWGQVSSQPPIFLTCVGRCTSVAGVDRIYMHVRAECICFYIGFLICECKRFFNL